MANWTEQREKVYLDRYSLKDSNGVPTENISETWERVAAGIAQSDEDYLDFLGLLQDFKFVPGGRILAGAGTKTEVTFYNCFCINIDNNTNPKNGKDSREAIFDTISNMVNIMSRGGGVGINWSTLRPSGAYLTRVNGTTTGPIEWMDVASKAVGAVMQGGSRRGAAMFMLDDWHPDVELFINAKRDLSKITNANISVAVSDSFMDAVKNDGDWNLEFPVTTHPDYNSDWDGDLAAWKKAKGSGAVKIYRTVKAKSLWRKLAEGAWDNGEPGVIFMERYNKLSTGAAVERIECVNPCGEQGLGAYSVCNLGAMNLTAYVDVEGKFNFEMFSKDVKKAVRFLDNVIDKNFYGDFEKTLARQMQLRRIGLSVMGLADVLIALGMRYGSPEAVEFTESVFREMRRSAIQSSMVLAIEKGPAGAWSSDMADRPYFSLLSDDERKALKKNGIRNLFLLTQAPTGTTSILAGVNSGIEPYFAFEYVRKDRTGTWKVQVPVLRDWIENNPGLETPGFFVTANEISVDDHINMQAAAQKHIDSSVSKTLNAPNSHTIDDVEAAYTKAYDAGLKSIAYFRDGCGRDQVLNREEPKPEVKPTVFSRPTSLTGTTTKSVTDVGTAFITVNRDRDGKPVEVFINVGKGGTDLQELSEALGRLISVSLQHGVRPDEIKGQLLGVGGYSKMMKSLPTAIAFAVSASDKLEAVAKEPEPAPTSEICPECQSFSLNHIEGCLTCAICGYSRC